MPLNIQTHPPLAAQAVCAPLFALISPQQSGSGIDEDPATGSWHTMLARVMSERFGKTDLKCHQAFPGRGAFIDTRLEGDRVKLIGTSGTVIEGSFTL